MTQMSTERAEPSGARSLDEMTMDEGVPENYLLRYTMLHGGERFYCGEVPSIMKTEMTALLAWIDKGDLCLAADGLTASREGALAATYERKTAKINNNAAMGAAISCWHFWLLVAHVMDIPVPKDFPNVDPEWARIVPALERKRILRPDLTLSDVVSRIDTYDSTAHPHPDGEFEAVVVLASSFDHDQRITVWRSRRGWVGSPGCLPAVFAPGTDEALRAAHSILFSDNMSPTEKAAESLKVIAGGSPTRVNAKGTLRRASTGYRMERIG